MNLILKLLVLPVVIILTPLTWIGFELIQCSAWIFGLASTLLTALGIFALLTVSPKDGIAFFVLAFLVSPYGLPMLAVHLVGILYDLNTILKQFIRG